MKPIFILATAMFFVNTAFSQIGGIGQSSSAAAGGSFDCRVRYTYDAVGNRIKRLYSCVEPEGPTEPGPFRASLFPNPSTGPFTVSFEELVLVATVSVYDMEGSFIGGAETEMAYEIDYDISYAVPGTYLVVLAVTREGGVETGEEFTLIKMD